MNLRLEILNQSKGGGWVTSEIVELEVPKKKYGEVLSRIEEMKSKFTNLRIINK